MILAEDEIGLGADHAGIMLLPDGLEPGTPLVDVLPLVDQVLDVTPTMNRPDLLSMVGIAREVAGLLDGELRLPDPADPPLTGARPVDVVVEDFGGCPRYIGRGFAGVAVGPSPQWLRSRLHLAGMRSISNVVDITNYVMHVWGSPLHAFDRALLADGRIVVRRAHEGETLRTLDGTLRQLLPSDLLITDGERPVALAAIMGGLESEVSDTTTEVLLEAANFEPIGVLKSSERLGLRTEGSNKWEKGVDPYAAEPAAVLASRLLVDLAGADLTGSMDAQEGLPERPVVTLRPGVHLAADRPRRCARRAAVDPLPTRVRGRRRLAGDRPDLSCARRDARGRRRRGGRAGRARPRPEHHAAPALGGGSPDPGATVPPAARGRSRRRRLLRGVHLEPRRERPRPRRAAAARPDERGPGRAPHHPAPGPRRGGARQRRRRQSVDSPVRARARLPAVRGGAARRGLARGGHRGGRLRGGATGRRGDLRRGAPAARRSAGRRTTRSTRARPRQPTRAGSASSTRRTWRVRGASSSSTSRGLHPGSRSGSCTRTSSRTRRTGRTSQSRSRRTSRLEPSSPPRTKRVPPSSARPASSTSTTATRWGRVGSPSRCTSCSRLPTGR